MEKWLRGESGKATLLALLGEHANGLFFLELLFMGAGALFMALDQV